MELSPEAARRRSRKQEAEHRCKGQTTPEVGGPSACAVSQICWHLYDDVGGLHRGHREHPGFELEFSCRLSRHQRHNPEWPTLDVDLRHHRVLDDASNKTRETIPGTLSDRRTQFWSACNFLGMCGELSSINGDWPTVTARA
jgi:hypothetical protein